MNKGTKAKDCIDAPIMLYRGRVWHILKVVPIAHGYTGKVFEYEFHIKDKRGNFYIRVCDENQRLKIPSY